MRIVHTSDWHLGRAFHQVGLLGAQAPSYVSGVTNSGDVLLSSFQPLADPTIVPGARNLYLFHRSSQTFERLGVPELATDPKFCDSAARSQNGPECIARLDAAFATKTLAEWKDLNAPIDVGTRKTVRVPLKTAGVKYRYYLIWITELARDEPGQAATAKIAEAVLLERKAS